MKKTFYKIALFALAVFFGLLSCTNLSDLYDTGGGPKYTNLIVLTPANGAYVVRPVVIEGIKGSDISSIVVIGGYNPKYADVLPDGSWSIMFEVYEVDSGINVFRIIGKGANGVTLNEKNLLLNIEVGTSGTNLPSVTIDEPAVSGKIYTNTQIAVSGTAGDANGLEGVYVSLNGVTFQKAYGVLSGSLASGWQTNLSLSNGSYTLYVKAKNLLGVESAVTQVSFIINTFYVSSDPWFNYYSSAYGKTGAQLKAALHSIIDGHTVLPYTSSSLDVWDALRAIDQDPLNANNVLTIYANQSIAKNKQSTGTEDRWTIWEREHLWPNSYGFNDETDWPPYTDIFALRPAIGGVNQDRLNYPFDIGGTPLWNTGNYLLLTNGVISPSLKKNASISWEPPDNMKGDIARAMFYMAVRYEGNFTYEPNLELVDNLALLGSDIPYMGKLSTLIQWHLADPTNAAEMLRNNLIYSNYQFNRNPFIDHPEWVTNIWTNW
ncbi:MAG: hypothetical protein A2Y33_15920 [Spirochaetes bacterium GWF1_51_8]|nr:MAG: hypothetical protein A2Y33_15920 [Spirochaetes bacterium GWF1_51_8]